MKLIEAATHLNIEPAFLIKFLNERSSDIWRTNPYADFSIVQDFFMGVYEDEYPWFGEKVKLKLGKRIASKKEIAETLRELQSWSEDKEINQELLSGLENFFLISEDQFSGSESIRNAIYFLRAINDPDDMTGVLLIVSVLAKRLFNYFGLVLPDGVYKYLIYSFLSLQGKASKQDLKETTERCINYVVDIIDRYIIRKHFDEIRDSETERPKSVVGQDILDSNFRNIALQLYNCSIHYFDKNNHSIFDCATEEQKNRLLAILDVIPIVKLWKKRPKQSKVKKYRNPRLPNLIRDASDLNYIILRYLHGDKGYGPICKDSRCINLLKSVHLNTLREIFEKESVFCKFKAFLPYEFYFGIIVIIHTINHLPSYEYYKRIIIYNLDIYVNQCLNKPIREDNFNLGAQVYDLCFVLYGCYLLFNSDLEDNEKYNYVNPKSITLYEYYVNNNTLERGHRFLPDQAESLFDFMLVYQYVSEKKPFGEWSNFMSDAVIQFSYLFFSRHPCMQLLWCLKGYTKYFDSDVIVEVSIVIDYFKKLMKGDKKCEIDKMFIPDWIKDKEAFKNLDERLRILLKYYEPGIVNLMNYSYFQYKTVLRRLMQEYANKHPEDIDNMKQDSLYLSDPVMYNYSEVPGDPLLDTSNQSGELIESQGSENKEEESSLSVLKASKANENESRLSVGYRQIEVPARRKKAGRKAKIWISSKCPIILVEQDPIKTAREKIVIIWNDIKNGLNGLVYPKGCDNGKRKEQAVNALGASLIYYAAITSGIAISKIDNNNKTIYDTSFGNTVSFISPISTVRPYWDMISLWFDLHRIQNNIERKNLYERIKKQNSKTKLLNILYVNHTTLIEIIETISRRLEEEFSN